MKSSDPRPISRGQVLIWIYLTAMAVIGVAGIIYAPDLPWEAVRAPSKDIASALLTAAILGATADRFFHAELARDVFRAAFRYVLPDEIKDEVNRIIDYRPLCIAHNSSVTIEETLTYRVVKVTLRSERKIKNISRHTEQIRNILTLDDWDIPEHKPSIDQCYLVFEDGERVDAGEQYVPRRSAIGKKTEYKNLPPGHTVTLVSVGTEMKHSNDEIVMHYLAPTVSPSVTVNIPKSNEHDIGFGVPNERISHSSILNKFTLEGTQFPGQHTRIRWWT
jgi:hypothetical protein